MLRLMLKKKHLMLKERETMGTPIINHQSIAFMLADMAAGTSSEI